jgi:hypothetical protein
MGLIRDDLETSNFLSRLLLTVWDRQFSCPVWILPTIIFQHSSSRRLYVFSTKLFLPACGQPLAAYEQPNQESDVDFACHTLYAWKR